MRAALVYGDGGECAGEDGALGSDDDHLGGEPVAGAVDQPGELMAQRLLRAGMRQFDEVAAADAYGGVVVELPEEFLVRLLDRQGRVETDDTRAGLIELAQKIRVLDLVTFQLVGVG